MNNTPTTTSDTHVEDDIYALFWWEKITEQTETFSPKTIVSRRNIQELFYYGTQEDLQQYANMDTKCNDRNIDDLLDELYPYFLNPDYIPDLAELHQDQKKAGEYILAKFSQTTEKIGTDTLIPKVSSKVYKVSWAIHDWTKGVNITPGIETYGSRKK